MIECSLNSILLNNDIYNLVKLLINFSSNMNIDLSKNKLLLVFKDILFYNLYNIF